MFVLMLSVILWISMTGILPCGSLHTSFWGPHTIDRYVNVTITHLPRFNSRFRVPGSGAVDTFQSRGRERIIGLVQHLLVCGAVGILVAPYWPSNAFWPFLFANAVESQPYVIASINFSDPSGIFALRCYEDLLLGSDRFNSAVLAVRIDARSLRAGG